MNRRGLLAGASATIGLAGCSWPSLRHDGAVATVSARGKLIDVHCHLFNGSDLPTVRFIKTVYLSHYRRQGIQTLDIEDPDVVDALLFMLTWIVGKTRAPTADAEIAVLDRRARSDARNLRGPANDEAVIAATADVIGGDGMGVSDDQVPGLAKIQQALFEAAGEGGLGVSDGPLTRDGAVLVARKAYASKFDIGNLLRWFALFTRYRFDLADELAGHHAAEGYEAALLCPAMIDYDLWLGENVDASPLPDQVAVMGRLARRSTGAVVHGYAAFDPLRKAYYDAGRFTGFDPLALVNRAIEEEGFLGVKLYPPMGFRPIGNSGAVCQTYPQVVLEALAPNAATSSATASCAPRPAAGSTLVGEKLDAAMAGLFDALVQRSACVIAHAGDSNGSGPGYGGRADHAHWIEVFRRWPTLRVVLAHFGGFQSRSAAAPAGSTFPEASWEWTLGRHIKAHPDSPVFADLSYFTEIAGKTPDELAAYTAVFTRWIAEFDPECRHLAFGTDWTMLGLEPAYEGYNERAYTYLRERCRLSEPAVNRILWENAARFTGLRDGDVTRMRLLAFYDRHGLPRTRLPSFA